MSTLDVSQPGQQGIGRQIQLPFSKAFEVAWKGIKIRIWRSLITMSGIVLAIAFLMSVWTSGVFTSAIEQVPADSPFYSLAQGVLEAKALASGGLDIRAAILESEESEARVPPSQAISFLLAERKGFTAEELPPDAAAVTEVLTEKLSVRADAFVMVGFPALLDDAEVSSALADYVREGGFLLIYGTRGIERRTALADILPARPGEGTFAASADTVTTGSEVVVSPQAWSRLPRAEFLVTDGKPGAAALATAEDNVPGWAMETGRGIVAWVPLVQTSADDPAVLNWFVRARTLEGGVSDVNNSLLVRLLAYGSRERLGGGVDTRRTWLVTLSLMVCVVGITNAMLMSVTERFREIGTMKCLGALDRFVVKLFLIESALQGVAGSLAGVLIGFLLAFSRAMFTFHVTDPETGQSYWLAWKFFPGSGILLYLAIAMVVGIALSIVAAIYPAIRAARMEPVQAMRVEE